MSGALNQLPLLLLLLPPPPLLLLMLPPLLLLLLLPLLRGRAVFWRAAKPRPATSTSTVSHLHCSLCPPTVAPTDAARLRDESGVGLLGWWVGRGPGDDHGHLLRVTTDFGRYCGTVYSPRDIGELVPVSAGCALG